MSSNSNNRQTKSLNDIPTVFKKRETDNVQSEHSNVSSGNVSDKHSDKHTCHAENAVFNESKLLETLKCSREEIEESTNEIRVSTICIDERLSINSKTDRLDPSKFVDTLLEDEDPKRKCNFTNLLETKLGKKKKTLSFIDVFLALILIAPLTVGFWRGVWTLMDIYADMFPGTLTFVLGMLVHTIFAILKNALHARAISVWKKKTLLTRFVCKITQIMYTYIFGVACNMQWRGGWIILDRFLVDNVWRITGTLIALLSLLIILRSVRNLIAIPPVLLVDKLSYVYRFPTRYHLIIAIRKPFSEFALGDKARRGTFKRIVFHLNYSFLYNLAIFKTYCGFT